jgi:uncharacterized RDD family membrane protein YckC
MGATGQSTQLDLGHWFLRLIAYIIDAVIFAVVVGILWLILFVPFLIAGALGGFFAVWGWVFLFPFLLGLLMVIYFLYTEVNWGGTIGKRILGLRVQTVNGGRINYSQSFIRNISKIHPLFLLLDWLIGIATAGDRRQKYTDRIAGTVVIQSSIVITMTPQPAPT